MKSLYFSEILAGNDKEIILPDYRPNQFKEFQKLNIEKSMRKRKFGLDRQTRQELFETLDDIELQSPCDSSVDFSHQQVDKVLQDESNLSKLQNVDWADITKRINEKYSPFDYYLESRNSTLIKESWNDEDDCKLIEAARYHNELHWYAIGKILNRSPTACLQRYRKLFPIHKIDNERDWSVKESLKLREAVKLYGENNFVYISKFFENKTPQQCYSHFRLSAGCSNDTECGVWNAECERKLLLGMIAYSPKMQKVLSPSEILPVFDSDSSDNEDVINVDRSTKRTKLWHFIAQNVPGKQFQQCKNAWSLRIAKALNGDDTLG